MAITSLTQVFGCSVSKLEFLNWLVTTSTFATSVPDSACIKTLASKWMSIALEELNDLPKYVDYLNRPKSERTAELDDYFVDYDSFVFSVLDEYSPASVRINGGEGYLNRALSLFVPTHDQTDLESENEDTIVIGVRTAYIMVDCDTVRLHGTLGLPVGDDDGEGCELELDSLDLLHGRKREFFVIQNDCACCS